MDLGGQFCAQSRQPINLILVLHGTDQASQGLVTLVGLHLDKEIQIQNGKRMRDREGEREMEDVMALNMRLFSHLHQDKPLQRLQFFPEPSATVLSSGLDNERWILFSSVCLLQSWPNGLQCCSHISGHCSCLRNSQSKAVSELDCHQLFTVKDF